MRAAHESWELNLGQEVLLTVKPLLWHSIRGCSVCLFLTWFLDIRQGSHAFKTSFLLLPPHPLLTPSLFLSCFPCWEVFLGVQCPPPPPPDTACVCWKFLQTSPVRWWQPQPHTAMPPTVPLTLTLLPLSVPLPPFLCRVLSLLSPNHVCKVSHGFLTWK